MGSLVRSLLLCLALAAGLPALGCRSADVLHPVDASAGGGGRGGGGGAPVDAAAAGAGGERGLVLRYAFEEGMGGFTRESTANQAISEFVGGVEWTSDVPAALQGASEHAVVVTGDQFLRMARDLKELVGGSVSLSVWLRTMDAGSKTDPGASPGLLASSDRGAPYWGVLDDAGRIGVVYGGTSAYSFDAVNDGAWHHVALTYDWGSVEMKVYVDAVLGAPAVGARADKWSLQEVLHGNGGRTLRGAFDELRIYDRVLTAPEVESLRRGRNSDGSPIAR